MKKLFGILLILLGISMLFSYIADSSLFSKEIRDNQSVDLSGVDTLKINVPSAEVNIIPEKDNDELTVALHGKGANGTNLSIQRNDKTVEVQVKSDWFNWSRWFFFNEYTMDVHIPLDYQQNLIIDMTSGNLAFHGPSADQPMQLNKLSLDMTSGEVDLNHLTVQEFASKSTSGDINVQWLTTESASFKVTSGDIDLTHFTGALTVKLTSGDFQAQMDEVSGNINLDMTSGNASFDLPNDAGFTLDGRVKSGNIRCDFPLQNAQLSQDAVRGYYGNGHYKIQLQGTSGDIAIF